MKSQEQILKALSGLIPEDAQKDVSEAVSTFLEGALADLDKEYNDKLEDAYKEIQTEKEADEKVAEEGYSQAWEIITDLRDRIEIQKEEFDQALEEGYEEAYQMLQEERSKNDTLEHELYEEYDRKLADIKEYMVDKVDQFLQLQGEKYYEMAKRDVMNDPTLAEHKLFSEKVIDLAANYITDDDYVFASSSKVEALQKQLDENKGQMKILEGKNMRLSMENTKLNETVRYSQDLITEHVGKTDKKERQQKARMVEGRGQTNTDNQVVIGEYAGETVTEKAQNHDADHLVEDIGEQVFADWRYLSEYNGNQEEVVEEPKAKRK